MAADDDIQIDGKGCMGFVIIGFLIILGGIESFVKESSFNFFIVLGIAVAIAYWYRKKRTGNSNQSATPPPVVEKALDMTYGFALETNDIINGKPYTLKIPNPFVGILINGTTGAGKTESVARPLIYQAVEKGYAGICYDYKFPALTENVHDAFTRNNKNLKGFVCVNFDDLSRTHRVNPLDPKLMRDSSDAYAYAASILMNACPEFITNPDFWYKNTRTYLASVIWFLREEHPQYCTLPHVINILLQPAADVMKMLATNLETKDMSAPIREAIQEKAGNQKAGVISTIQVALAQINTPNAAYVLSGNDFSIDLNNPNAPKFLCIGNDGMKKHNVVISVIITAAIQKMNVPNKRHSLLILDEAPTIFIPNLEGLPAVSRDRRLGTVFFAQDLSQIEEGYGKKKADILQSNLHTHLYMKVRHLGTAKHVSEIWGKEDKWVESKSTGTGESQKPMELWETTESKNQSVSYSLQERDRIKPQDVLKLEKGEVFAMLSESDYTFVRTKLRPNKYPPAPKLPAFKSVPDDEAKKTWLRIKKESIDLLASYQEDSSSSPDLNNASNPSSSQLSDDSISSLLDNI